MARLRYLAKHDRVTPPVIADAASPLAVRHAHTARGSVSQASKMPNPPNWLIELDISTWAAHRVANVERMRRQP